MIRHFHISVVKDFALVNGEIKIQIHHENPCSAFPGHTWIAERQTRMLGYTWG